MSRDRLAALRAQRQEQQQQQQQPALELNALTPPPVANVSGNGITAFFEEIASLQSGIEQLNGNVAIISTLHGRTINVVTEGTNPDAQQLDMMRGETRTLINKLKDRLTSLETLPAGPDANIRKNQIARLRSNFLEAVQKYQRVEHEYRQQSRRRIERQLRIVKEDATDEEVRAAVEGGADQVFAQALTVSTRYGESRAAYREVQERQEDLRKIEDTMAELTQLLSDMALLVARQDPIFDEIDRNAVDTEANTKQGLEHTKKAVVHARRYRKMRWICFFIILIVCAVVAIVLGVVLGGNHGH